MNHTQGCKLLTIVGITRSLVLILTVQLVSVSGASAGQQFSDWGEGFLSLKLIRQQAKGARSNHRMAKNSTWPRIGPVPWVPTTSG